METTTNYGLRKYQSGDLFNPLTVNNPNLDDIDADMKAVSDRAIGRATELVSQGVHAITLLDTDCKTFKFVATGNYSAGETFTVNGIQANAYTPSGSALTSDAFVTGSIVLGTLNEDGTAITFYVTGSAVADDSLKLGGELPSYYATQSDMTSAKTDITNLKNQAGNTSIAGIGDGTLSGAVSSLNNDLNNVKNLADFSFSEHKIGTYNGKDLYRRIYHTANTTISSGVVIDSSLNLNYVDSVINIHGTIFTSSAGIMPASTSTTDSFLTIRSNGLYFGYAGGYGTITKYDFVVEYTKA